MNGNMEAPSKKQENTAQKKIKDKLISYANHYTIENHRAAERSVNAPTNLELEIDFYKGMGITLSEAEALHEKLKAQSEREWLDLLDENEQRWREKNEI